MTLRPWQAWAIGLGIYFWGCITVPAGFWLYFQYLEATYTPEVRFESREVVGECVFGEDHTFPTGRKGVIANCRLYGFGSLGEKPSPIFVTVDDSVARYVTADDATVDVLMRDKTWENIRVKVERKTNSPGRTVRVDLPQLDANLTYTLKVYLHPRTDHKLPNVVLTNWVDISTVEPPANPYVETHLVTDAASRARP